MLSASLSAECKVLSAEWVLSAECKVLSAEWVLSAECKVLSAEWGKGWGDGEMGRWGKE
ncbi:hypothetical protein H6G20_25755 [Desertifilum sp. FACHB-1129]|uniref:hypothetical protein n=1 Tax=Desertifilum TaxID=1185872 RepID=UPI0013012FFA|nr:MULTISPECIES: hypothetical protein [Desertifilum]MBD2315076.1 hypothetical protein [Desertifilum sp. FACHB-1129]MBD2323338.1 hypothetical protein [Desertifilum sp. FACHB-866]MBD2333183.1 hypothetical protein [Desertifilum sp. FACHB-868]MDA0209265.1 hypothetical protein [Cyanobacteria bacterium FC1]